MLPLAAAGTSWLHVALANAEAEADVCHAPAGAYSGTARAVSAADSGRKGGRQRGRQSQLPLAIKRGPRPLNKAKLLNVSMRFMQRQNGAPQSTHSQTHKCAHTHTGAHIRGLNMHGAIKRRKERNAGQERGKSRQGKCKINWQLPLAAAGVAAPRRAAPHCAAADATATACHSDCLLCLPAARLAVAYFSGAGQHCCCQRAAQEVLD